MNQVRVRFAPSPTGALHIGGVRTALYNYLFAKKNGGKFILRVEDTDQSRYVKGAEEYIKESLEWCGINPDESPYHPGEFGPYRQSERKDLYKQYVDQLLENDLAYYAFDTPEELDAMRERLKEAKVHNPQYNSITRMQMSNSLTLSAEEVKSKIDSGVPYVVRIKVPAKEDIRINDLIRGWVKVHSSTIDDKVLMKSDGMPTYHLANVVDDHLMEITHVIRGEEWLPSAPLHVLLYKFLGWEETMPQFAHLPLLLKPDGNGKLSKRDGDKLGFPVFPINGDFPGKDGSMEHFSGYREAGYLPEGFINFIAFLGWNPGTEQEIFSVQELVENFSLERINKAGAKFDIEKAKWYNQQYLKSTPENELANYIINGSKEAGFECSESTAIKIAGLLKERVTFIHELWDDAKIFFELPESYDDKVVKKKWTQEAVTVLTDYAANLGSIDSINSEEAKSTLEQSLEKFGINIGRVMQALRLSITGAGGGPDLMMIIEVLGPKEVSKRIEIAIDTLAERVKS